MDSENSKDSAIMGTQTPNRTQDRQEPNAAIRVSGLTKRFGSVQALAGVEFSVAPGEFFGLLGPNGAGKTTTIRILTGLSRPDEGAISINEMDCRANPKAAQRMIGVVPDESNLYPELTGYQNLCFCGALYGMKKQEREARASELLETFGLSHAAHRLFAGYSKGMKRRLTIAAGMVHSPDILFLDEPTTGIDVASARQIRQLIQNLHEQGTTILLTTHYIEEAERLCERIAFIVNGRIIKTDKLENLLAPVRGRHILRIAAHPLSDGIVQRLRKEFGELEFVKLGNDALQVQSNNPLSIGPMVRFFEEQNVVVTEARKIQPSLEDVFVETTGIEAQLLRQDGRQRGMKGGAK